MTVKCEDGEKQNLEKKSGCGSSFLPGTTFSILSSGFILGYLLHTIDFSLLWRSYTTYTEKHSKNAYRVNDDTDSQAYVCI